VNRTGYSVRLESDDLDCDDLHVVKLEGTERISQPFRFDVDLTCIDPAGLDVAKTVGALVTLVFSTGDELVRRVHGVIETVEDRLETEAAYRSYRFQIVPRLRRLALVETSDVFTDASVPEIARQKLELVGLDSALDDRLLDKYPTREFVVQYQETDLAFVSRLLEHLGISYVFRHDEDQDRVLLVDAAHTFPRLELEVCYQGRGERTDVYRLEARTTVIPNHYVVQDYNYRTPRVDVVGEHRSALGFAGGVVEFGNHTKTVSEANALARVRGEQREAQQVVYHGESAVMALSAGSRFSLSDHPHVEDDLLLVAVTHHMVQPAMMSGGSATEKPATYRNTFEAIPANRTYRPPRVTPRPRIAGVVTGIIEMPDGASNRFPLIDDEGRYTVRFPFDTAAPGERKASHPVRLAQLSAGSRYGTHFPLRPGVEVMIAFTGGDPDRPIIAGAVPNPEVSSPVVGADAMKSRIKSESGVLIEFSDK
jgi:type VI secretion system secreted protein VgrG